ncbi:MAG: hypothetical protein R3F54_11070 [Alphaproteobacteria bacterium]
MPASDSFDRIINYKFILPLAAIALLSSLPLPGQAQPAVSVLPEDKISPPTLEELHAHAETIADILETASERVERLAESDEATPDLLAAIRQELSLSRRWNQHLTGILQDVAEERRALGEREREAAREIARMTAAAEEARLELIALEKVLKGQPKEAEEGKKGWTDSRTDRGAASDLGDRVAAHGPIADLAIEHGSGLPHDLDRARSVLASMDAAQTSVLQNVDTVRSKIIEALQTLAAQGDRPLHLPAAGGDLSSEDITAWAASIATKTGQAPAGQGE